MDEIVEIIALASVRKSLIAKFGTADIAIPEPLMADPRANAWEILSALSARGLAVVPVKPTREMFNAYYGQTSYRVTQGKVEAIWSAMLAARPSLKGEA